MTFYGNKNEYVRTVVRGESAMFESLEQRDVVLQSVLPPRKGELPAAMGQFTDGDSVLYVPMCGQASDVGVLEIHGLYAEGVTDMARAQRPNGALKAMIAAKDYRFKHKVKFWRKPGTFSGGVVVRPSKNMEKATYPVVCGRVTDWATEKNGITYYGGARFTVTWEDGLVEEGLPAAQLAALYTHTPQSLGACTVLDEELIEELARVGRHAGHALEIRRLEDHLTALDAALFVPELKDATICDHVFNACVNAVPGARDVRLVGISEQVRLLARLDMPVPGRCGRISRHTNPLCPRTGARLARLDIRHAYEGHLISRHTDPFCPRTGWARRRAAAKGN